MRPSFACSCVFAFVCLRPLPTCKYRLYPNQAQVQFLENQCHEACEHYAALQERRDAWKGCRKSIHYYDQANQLKPIRE